MPTKIWNDWKYEDGDYIAEHNEPLKNTLFVNVSKTKILSIVGVIFSIALFVLVLI